MTRTDEYKIDTFVLILGTLRNLIVLLMCPMMLMLSWRLFVSNILPALFMMALSFMGIWAAIKLQLILIEEWEEDRQ